MSDKASKTEKPTPQRKQEAKRDGQIPRTAELSAWVAVLVASVLVPKLVRDLADLFRDLLSDLQRVIVQPDPGVAIGVLKDAGSHSLLLLAPLLGAMVVAAIVSNAAQGGIRIYAKKFKPKFETLNPAKGLKNLVGAHAAWQLVKTLLKFGVFGWIGYHSVQSVTEQISTSGEWSLGASVGAATGAALSILRVIAAVGLVLAAADYVMERRRMNSSLKMSLEDIKRENKSAEGDPLQKGMIRGKQREMSRNRMMSDLSSADLVLVNPTHVAVALAYEPGRGAPRVVAKGAGLVAAKIREDAVALRLPLVEDVPLARMLYRNCPLGHEIPAELYDAVAAVFVFVMGLRQRGAARGFHRNPHAARMTPAQLAETSGPRALRR
ncbi:EscU/YscU/HrcU family type III secretion system export apparatus switch protein [Pedococcus sp. KACC 23699]|uniref:EscU/YscU/HrcU family type III secretion system export apparatus switch protein n=1 Tax=Pedococcus sp. KACC 23699 TaxID=3149228 RepID=A0AAU7JZH5_9MICO